jgi:hypothetical protein
MPTAPLQHVATLGIDVGKTTFHLIGLEVRGAIVLRQKLSRGQAFVDFVSAQSAASFGSPKARNRGRD